METSKMNKTTILFISLVAMLVLAVWGAIYMWNEFGDIEISTAGILAMLAGIILSLALGIGLMYLVFKSERKGEESE